MIKKIFLLLILLSTVVSGETFEEFRIQVVEDTSVVQHKFIPEDHYIFNYTLPSDYKGLSINVDGNFQDTSIKNVKLAPGQILIVEYVTSSIVNNNEIIFNVETHDSDELMVSVELDEDARLKYASGEGEITTSVYPTPYSLSSNGRNIIVKWIRKNYDSEEFSGLILLEDKKDFSWIYPLLILFLIVMIVFISILKKKEVKEDKKSSSEKTDAKEDKDILKHLKGDEKQVFQILVDKEGQAEQGTIRVIGNFSKATLSRILSELEEREIIYKEKKGKKNIVHLK